MKKQFLFNILLLIILNVLIKPFWVFGIDRTVQNSVGSEAYGLYFALFNFSILFNAFLDLGINNYNNRTIAQTPALISSQFPRIVLIKLLLGLVYMLLCLGMALASGYSSNAFILLVILSINQILASFLLFLRSNISGLQMYFADSIISVTDRALMIILCSILLWTNLVNIEMNITTFALLQTFAYASTALFALAILVRKGGLSGFKNVPLFSVSLFRKTLPFALLALLMVVYNRVDAVLLERLLPNGAKAAGIYAQSYRIFDAINMVSVLFASLLLPMFARLIAQKADIKPLVSLSFSILFSATIIFAVVLTYFNVPFLSTLYQDIISESHTVFNILVLSTIPVAMSYIFGTLLTADGRLFSLNLIAGAALFLNLGLNFLLIPKFGVSGAAITAITSQLLVATAQFIVCLKSYSLSFSRPLILSFILLVFASIFIAFMVDVFSIHIMIKILLSLMFSGVMVFVLKIVDLQEIYTLIRSETPH